MEYFVKKIEQIRNVRPLMSITTDVITGFPGETDLLFLETISNINKDFTDGQINEAIKTIKNL